jgi:hypothetical protein
MHQVFESQEEKDRLTHEVTGKAGGSIGVVNLDDLENPALSKSGVTGTTTAANKTT